MKWPPLLSMKQRDVRVFKKIIPGKVFSHKGKLKLPYFQNSKSLSLHSTPNLKTCYFNLFLVIYLIRDHKMQYFGKTNLDVWGTF